MSKILGLRRISMITKKISVFLTVLVLILFTTVICFRIVYEQKYTQEEYAELKQNYEIYENNLNYLKQEIKKGEEDIASLHEKRNELLAEIDFAKGKTVYFIKVEMSKTSYTLSISQHVSDAMNAVELEIPVDKDFYDSVTVGQSLSESFNSGSFLLKGKFSSHNVKIISKYSRERGIK